MATVKIPRGLYSEKHDGLGDPDRWSPDDRYVRSDTARQQEDERTASEQFSANFMGKLNAARRRAVGR